MDDEHLDEANVHNPNFKQDIINKISEKLHASNEKSVLILLDNFNYLFANSDYYKASLDILNELTCLKKRFK